MTRNNRAWLCYKEPCFGKASSSFRKFGKTIGTVSRKGSRVGATSQINHSSGCWILNWAPFWLQLPTKCSAPDPVSGSAALFTTTNRRLRGWPMNRYHKVASHVTLGRTLMSNQLKLLGMVRYLQVCQCCGGHIIFWKRGTILPWERHFLFAWKVEIRVRFFSWWLWTQRPVDGKIYLWSL